MYLQLFAEEKTEKATPKKRQDVRKKGQVFQSRDLNNAVILLIGALLLNIFFPVFVSSIFNLIKQLSTIYIQNINDIYTIQNMHAFFTSIILSILEIILPALIIILIASLAMNFGQVGFAVSGENMGFKLNRLNPIEGFKRIFSKKGIIELLKSILKIVIVGYVAYVTIRSQINIFPRLMNMSVSEMINYLESSVVGLGLKLGLVVMILSVLDYAYQWWDFEKNIMMTKEEIKEELKETEGNPQIKSKVRDKQRRMSMNRMIKSVEDADVVITNPTHIAVALKYDPKIAGAPLLVAKGVDFLAEKIKNIAKKNDVPIVENVQVARALYSMTEIGEAIPEDLYYAVAEILAFVYSMNKEQR